MSEVTRIVLECIRVLYTINCTNAMGICICPGTCPFGGFEAIFMSRDLRGMAFMSLWFGPSGRARRGEAGT